MSAPWGAVCTPEGFIVARDFPVRRSLPASKGKVRGVALTGDRMDGEAVCPRALVISETSWGACCKARLRAGHVPAALGGRRVLCVHTALLGEAVRALGQGPGGRASMAGGFQPRGWPYVTFGHHVPQSPRELMLLKSPLPAAGVSVLAAGTKQPQFLISCGAGKVQSAGR